MANLIRLKQIESGSYLNTAATIGQDFSQSVIDIISTEVTAVLPDGVISSSVQIDLLQTTNFVGFSSSISNSFGDVYMELASITGSIETGLSASVATSFSQSNAIFNQFSSSIHSELSQSNTIFTQFSSSINTQISASSANTIDISSSVNARLVNLESFSSSLDNGFATDAELTLTSSQIIDQGEW
jgi:methyltransferase-like protein